MGADSGSLRPPDLGGLLEAAPDAMVVIDAEGTILLVNAQTERLFGYRREDLLGRAVEALVPANRHLDHRRHRAGYLGEPHVRAMGSGLDLRARRKDGSEFPVEISLSPLETDDGLLVLAAVRDVTSKRRQERMFRGLLEAAPDAMVIVDQTGRIVLVNAQVEKQFGYERTELVGQPVEVLVPARYADVHESFRTGYVHGPRTRPMGSGLDLRARRKDGTEFPVEISLAPLETEDGLLVSAAVRDISERRRMQDAADRAKDEFFATVSHELRTPLTSLLGYCELMADLERLSPQGDRFLQVIMRSAERELRLVDDLLTLVQIEERGLAVRRTTLDLGSVVHDAVEAARPRAVEAGIDLRLEGRESSSVTVAGDRDRLGQAIDNLLSNALKFTPAGGQVVVRMESAHGRAVVEVIDSGTGIADADRERVFERAFRADNAVSRQVPGAGLGLTITRAIVEAHDGSIRLASTGPDGTTFRMSFPLVG